VNDKDDEYLQHALYCITMAESAARPEVKSNWQRLAEKWLSMVSGETVPQNLASAIARANALDPDQPETRQPETRQPTRTRAGTRMA
jgi:hypothetical protein